MIGLLRAFVVALLLALLPAHAYAVCTPTTAPNSVLRTGIGYSQLELLQAICNNTANISVTTSVSGYAPAGTAATLAVTTTTGNVALPAGAVIAVYNTGASAVTVKLGTSNAVTVTATMGEIIQPGSWSAYTVGSNTYLAGITASSTSSLVITGGSGLLTGAGGGSSGGGGGSVTANAGTNLNTSALALETGGNLAGAKATLGTTIDTANAATDTTAASHTGILKQISKVFQDVWDSVNHRLKVDGSGVTQPVSASSLPLPAGAATAANQSTIITALGTLNTTAGNALAGGEAHVGEVGGNQIAVQVAQTVTASSAYASGNAVGGLMTIANAARVSGSLGASGTGGILQNVSVNSKSAQTTQMDLFIFKSNPSGSTCTDKTAFSLATADFDKVIGVVTVPGTAANGAGWFASAVASVGIAINPTMAYDLASATSLYGCLVTRGTPTFGSTSDISVTLNLLRN